MTRTLSRLGTLMAAALIALCFTSVARADDTFNVNSTADSDNVAQCQAHAADCTLRGAIDAANADTTGTGNDTINVPPGRYDRGTDPGGSYPVAGGSGKLLIQSTTGNSADVTISADGNDRVFDAQPGADLTLAGVTVQDGFATDCNGGGGVRVEQGLKGGQTHLTVDNTRIVKNVAICADDGGGIFADRGTTVVVQNGSHVDGNNTDDNGGGIAYYGSLSVADSTVDGNTANGTGTNAPGGGGIWNGGSDPLTVSNSSVSNNVDNGYSSGGLTGSRCCSGGGGISNPGGSDLSITNSHLDRNFEESYGGAIASIAGNITIDSSTLNNNEAHFADGGAIYNLGNCNCSSSIRGGLNPGTQLQVKNSTLSNNIAAQYGGAISNLTTSLLTVTGSTLDHNSAGGPLLTFLHGFSAGGAIYNKGRGVTLDTSTLTNNSAGNGIITIGAGGAVANENGDLNITGSKLNQNNGSFAGGAVLNGAVYGYGGNPGAINAANSQFDDNNADFIGGGIYNAGQALTLSDHSAVDRNVSRLGQGGGIFNDHSDLSLTDGSVSDNRADGADGGGIYNAGNGNLSRQGDIVLQPGPTQGTLTLTRMSVDRNVARASRSCGIIIIPGPAPQSCSYSGGNGGGVYNAGGPSIIADSSLSKNIAGQSGGGLYDSSYTVNEQSSSIANSTFASNQADSVDGSSPKSNSNPGKGGGIFADQSGPMSLTNVTVAGNLSATGDGGGVYSNGSQVDLKNTIVADNQKNGADPSNCGGGNSNYVSNGNNLDGFETDASAPDQCGLTDGANGDLANRDPRLGPLQDNGGPTLTRALLVNSPAIDGGDDGACSGLTSVATPHPHDQRQANRPAGAHCDIGAYEANSLADLVLISKTAAPDPVVVGQNLTYTITAHNNGPDGATDPVVTDALPATTTLVSSSTSQGTCSGTTTVTCHLGPLGSGATATVTIVVRPNAAGPLTNTAAIGGSPTDNNSSNDSASVTSTVNPAPGTSVQLVGGQRLGCADNRKFKFVLHHAPHQRVVKIQVFVDGTLKVNRTGRNITSFTLSRLPSTGNFTVKIFAVQSSGSTLTSVRKYKGCIKTTPRTKGHHAHPHHP